MIPFTKMHGLGNDYVYLDAFETPSLADRPDLADCARRMSDRHLGVGSDGLILVAPPADAEASDELPPDARMIMFNADGSVGAMCGNGLRCVAALVVRRGHGAPRDGVVRIATASGVRDARVRLVTNHGAQVAVDMGEPSLEPASIPADVALLKPEGVTGDAPQWSAGELTGVLVSMGNPHFVSFAAQLPDEAFMERVGPAIERRPAFAERINVHVVSVLDRRSATMATWERGAGRTMACGSGACAALVAGVLTHRLERAATIRLPAGELSIEWSEETNRVEMTGPAVEVFRGEWPG